MPGNMKTNRRIIMAIKKKTSLGAALAKAGNDALSAPSPYSTERKNTHPNPRYNTYEAQLARRRKAAESVLNNESTLMRGLHESDEEYNTRVAAHRLKALTDNAHTKKLTEADKKIKGEVTPMRGLHESDEKYAARKKEFEDKALTERHDLVTMRRKKIK
jgi:hypothetical protein